MTIKPFITENIEKKHLYIPMNIIFIVGLLSGAMSIKLYVIVKVNMLEMKMLMAFMKYIQIP